MRKRYFAKKRRAKGGHADRHGDKSIASERVAIAQRVYSIDLQENARGRVLQIVEQSGGRLSRIMLPCSVAAEFLELLDRLAEYEALLPPLEGWKGEAPQREVVHA